MRLHAVIPIALGCIFAMMLGIRAGAVEKSKEERTISGTGVIKYIDIEGGFYGIIADDGQKFLPRNLPTDFKKDGLRIAFQVKLLTGVVSIQMWGKPVEVVSMEKKLR